MKAKMHASSQELHGLKMCGVLMCCQRILQPTLCRILYSIIISYCVSKNASASVAQLPLHVGSLHSALTNITASPPRQTSTLRLEHGTYTETRPSQGKIQRNITGPYAEVRCLVRHVSIFLFDPTSATSSRHCYVTNISKPCVYNVSHLSTPQFQPKNPHSI